MATETLQERFLDVGNSSVESRRNASWSLWAIGGIPIILTFIQGIFAAWGTPAVDVPIIGFIASALRSYEFLDQVAIIFFNSSTLILFLFFVITAAWIGQGYALRTDQDRSIVYGTASISSVFYFLLFWGVYWPLSPIVANETATLPSLIFFAIPVFSSGSVLASARLQPAIDSEIANILADAREELDTHQTNFEVEISDRIGTDTLDALDGSELNQLENLGLDEDIPSYISVDCEKDKEVLESHRDKLDEIRTDIERVANYSEANEETLKDAKQVRAKVQLLTAPSEIVNDVESNIRDKVKNNIEAVLRSELKEYKSYHSDNYDVKNLPTNLQSVDLDHIDGQTTLTNSPNYFGDKLDSHEHDILPIIKDAQLVIQRIHAVNGTLSKEKKALEFIESDINDSLSVVSDQLSTVRGKESELIRKLFVDGNIAEAEIINESDVRNLISDAYDYHYDCQFDKQAKTLLEAQLKADILISVVEFITTISNAAASSTDIREFSIPSNDTVQDPLISDTVFETLSNEFQSLFDTKLKHDSQSVKIIPSAVDVDESSDTDDEYETTLSGEGDLDDNQTGGEHSDSQIEEEELTKGMTIDGVNTLLNHAETKAGELDRPDVVGEQTLSLDPDSLPPLATESKVLAAFRRILLEDPNIESVETNKEGSQSLITITATNSDISIVDVIRNVKEEFNNE